MFIVKKSLNRLMASNRASDFIKPTMIMIFIVVLVGSITATVAIEYLSWLYYGEKKKRK
jgi:hypothetical protein